MPHDPVGMDWSQTPPLDVIPDAQMRKRMRAFYAALAEIDSEAHGLYEEYGWERVGAWASRTVDENPRLRLLVDMGWAVNDISGVLGALDKCGREQVRRGNFDTALVLRLLMLSTKASGPPGDPERMSRPVVRMLNYLDRVTAERPTDEDWDIANVDAAIFNAEHTAAWEEAMGDGVEE